MRDKYLVVIGCQKGKLEQISTRTARSILDYIHGNQHLYTGTISIIRKSMKGDRNFKKAGDTVTLNDNEFLDYKSDNIIEVPGYDLDCSQFRQDAHYDIIGISTAASVLTMAMSMYSWGLSISVLAKYCEDRKSKKLEEHAFEIMKAYMPGVIK